VREAFGLDCTHLLAHSYGGPLALEHLLRLPDSGVVSVVLSNSFASVPGLVAGWEQRLEELGPETAAVLRAGDPGSELYLAALGEFVNRFVIPGPPAPPLVAAQSGMGHEVYAAMHGSSWFSPDGRWADWDATARLTELDMPLLAVCGEQDQCVPALSQAIAAAVPNGEVVVLPGGHLPMVQDPEPYLAVVRAFLEQAEGGRGRSTGVVADRNGQSAP
jgi:proline iminopeptidase